MRPRTQTFHIHQGIVKPQSTFSQTSAAFDGKKPSVFGFLSLVSHVPNKLTDGINMGEREREIERAVMSQASKEKVMRRIGKFGEVEGKWGLVRLVGQRA